MRLFGMFALSFATLLLLTPARAQPDYPSRPVRILCGFPAGSTLDIATRIFAQRLEATLKQPFVVENKPGASGNLAAEVVSRSSADGYTLLTGGITQAISMSLFREVKYEVTKDLEPIGFISLSPNVLVVNRSINVDSVEDLIVTAKKMPGELTYGTGGVGTAPHLAGELFDLIAGVKLVHVPYKGTNQAILDLLSGRLSLMFAPTATIAPYVNDPRLKLLAVTSARRSSMLPDVPSLTELPGFAGFDNSVWQGMWAPKGTPTHIVQKINNVLTEASQSAEVKAALSAVGTEPIVSPSDKFGAYVAAEVEKWRKVIISAQIAIQ